MIFVCDWRKQIQQRKCRYASRFCFFHFPAKSSLGRSRGPWAQWQWSGDRELSAGWGGRSSLKNRKRVLIFGKQPLTQRPQAVRERLAQVTLIILVSLSVRYRLEKSRKVPSSYFKSVSKVSSVSQTVVEIVVQPHSVCEEEQTLRGKGVASLLLPKPRVPNFCAELHWPRRPPVKSEGTRDGCASDNFAKDESLLSF